MAQILVVDDEPHLRLILRRQLEGEGYTVDTADDGFQAIEFLEGATPDLVILDIMMPRMDGIDVMRWMKKNYRTASIPVIFLTARSDQTEKVAGLVEGANDYLTKPYEKAELTARIRNTLEFSQRQRQASPLTGLPGNAAIQEELARRIDARASYGLIHVDIDGFKCYNDFYGYQRGDYVIRRTCAIIVEEAGTMGGDSTFVGHVGGDDFVLITDYDLGVPLAERIATRFDEIVPGLYDEGDRRREYIEVANRRGVPERFPFMTITIAVALDEGGRYGHVGEVGAVISELKRHGKTQVRTIVVADRRHTSELGADPDAHAKGTRTA